MRIKSLPVVAVLILSTLFLSACNLPSRNTPRVSSPTSPAMESPGSTPTPARLCDHRFFPTSVGDTWEYSGSNTVLGAYTRTDLITVSSPEAFTVESQQAGVSFSTNFTCDSAGLIATNPLQPYLGALLNSPDASLQLNLGSVSGITLPANLNPGDTWQQTVDWQASSADLNLNGRLVIDYTAGDYEEVSVPYGSFNAMRVDATVRIQLSALHIPAGSYTLSTWIAPGVGVVKNQGTSHVPQVDFSDSMELTSFSPSP